MTERYANQQAPTFIVGTLAFDATTGVVFAQDGLPSAGNFRIVIGQGASAEIVIVGGRTGTTLTGLQRGQEGTTAQTWPEGTPVSHVLTAASYGAGIDDKISDHAVEDDPHPGYATDVDLATHETDPSAHPGLAAGGDVTGAITAHEAGADPHPVYLTSAEGDAKVTAHTAAGDPHSQYATDTDLTTHHDSTNPHPNVDGGVAVAGHVAGVDPHTQYQKESERGVANGYAGLDASGTVPDAQIPSAIARDTEVTSAVNTHSAASDPHPGYATDNDLANHAAASDPHPTYATDSDLSTHAAASDPHAGYQKESEKGNALGYASLDSGGTVPDGQIPSAITRDTELAAHEADTTAIHGISDTSVLETTTDSAAKITAHAALSDPHPVYQTSAESQAQVDTHAGAADPHPQYDTSAEAQSKVDSHAGAANPHTGYQLSSAKGAVNGYASLDSGGTVPDGQIPAAITRDTELAAHEADTTGIHGISDTAVLETTTGSQAKVNTHAAAADPHPVYQTSAESQAQVDTHAAAVDPHPQYDTSAEAQSKVDTHVSANPAHPANKVSFSPTGSIASTDVQAAIAEVAAEAGASGAHPDLATHDSMGLATDTELATHAAAADPHTGYQKESEKGAVSGYASLDGGGTVPDSQIPAAIARDSEVSTSVSTAVSTHAALPDVHHARQHALNSGSDHTGLLDDSQIPSTIARDTEVTSAVTTAVTTHEAASDPHPTYLKESENGRVYNIRSVTAGTADDTAVIQGLHDAASDGDTIRVQPGTYTITQLNWTKKVNIIGIGTPEEVVFRAKSGASGPLLNVNFASLKHHLRLENFYIDLTNTTTIVGLYLNNLDLASIANVKVREGTVGFDIDSVATSDFNQCWVFNQRTSGFRVKNAASLDNTYNRCVVYLTSGATADMTVAGFDIQNGASNYLNGVRVLRDTSSSFNMPYGIKLNSPATTDWLFLNNVVVDGVTDGTGANSATSASLYLLNSTGVFSTNSFYSANASAGQKQRGVRIDGGSRITFEGGRISGSGLAFANTVDTVSLVNVDFPANFSDAALNFGASTVTNLSFSIPTPGGAITDDNVKLSAATASTKGYLGNGRRMLVSDATAAESLILEHASTGKTKRIRVNNGATGTLEFLADNGTSKIAQITDAGQIIVGSGSNTMASGTGTPEGAKTAPIGSVYFRTDGGAATTFYVKESGVGNTGWVAQGGAFSERAAASTTPAPIGTAAVGTGTTDARADHVHATGAGTPSTQAIGDSAAVGTGPAAAMTDHKHAMPSFGTNSIGLGTTAAAGSAATLIRSDATIAAFDATSPTTQAFGDAAVVGVAAFAARRDHKHGMPSAPTTIANDTLWAAAGDLVYGTANDTAAILSANATATNKYLRSVSSGNPTWQQIAYADISGTPSSLPPSSHGASVHDDITRSLWIDIPLLASNMNSPNNASFSTSNTGTDSYQKARLADGLTQGFFFKVPVPTDWASGAVTYKIYWIPSATSTGAVRWSISALDVAPGGTAATAVTPLAYTGDNAARTANLLAVESAQTLVTPSAAGNVIRCSLQRIGTDGADTYVGNVDVIGIQVLWTATQ